MMRDPAPALLLTLVALLAGCSSAGPVVEDQASPEVSQATVGACGGTAEMPEGAVDLFGDIPVCGGPDALMTGTLAGDSTTGCLWIESGDRETLITWPRGWYVMSDGTVHDDHGEPQAVIGEEVDAGGASIAGAPKGQTGACPSLDGSFGLNSLIPARHREG